MTATTQALTGPITAAATMTAMLPYMNDTPGLDGPESSRALAVNPQQAKAAITSNTTPVPAVFASFVPLTELAEVLIR